MLAYGELTAFDRLADDARLAPDAGRPGGARRHGGRRDRPLPPAAPTGSPSSASTRTRRCRPFVEVVRHLPRRTTAPSTWLEGLVKAYVGDGIAADFYREVAEFLDPSTRELVLEVLADTGHADFAVREVRAAIQADPALAGRLALWARRLVGEAMSQAQRVAAERDALAAAAGRRLRRPRPASPPCSSG